MKRTFVSVSVLNKIGKGVHKCASFLAEQKRLFVIGFMNAVFLTSSFAQDAGKRGFDSATQAINGYGPNVQSLMYAIAAVIAIVGAFNVYFKMQNGDQDVKKTIMMTVGGCVAFVAMATALPLFFGASWTKN